MKRRLNSEDGHALLLVLLLLTVITIITIPIIANVTSSAHQFQSTKQHIHHDNMKEMGIIYMEKAVEYAVMQINAMEAPPGTADAYRDAVISELTAVLPNLQSGYTKVVKENAHYFKVQLGAVELVTNDDIKINYSVTTSETGDFADGQIYNEAIIIAIIKESEL